MSTQNQVDENNLAAEGQEEDDDDFYAPKSTFLDKVALIPSWLLSMVIHMIILLCLALITFDTTPVRAVNTIVSNPTVEETFEELEEIEEVEMEEIDVEQTDMVEVAETTVTETDVSISPADETEAAAVQVNLIDVSNTMAPRNDLGNKVGAYSGDAFAGRGAGKGRAVAMGGGNEASERSVAAALQWIANHQMPDGSWCFNHQLCPSCKGQCKDPGSQVKALNGATAMAILPFLGAGQTHQKGKYAKSVRGGLYFLARNGKVQNGGVSFHEAGGTMYSHGLATICMSEGYAMTKDKGLLPAAQGALNFICYAQDPAGGGWRYQPRQAGDTSVVGWQLMALKSGHMAYLRITNDVIPKATRFLDAMQANSGANYGYTEPGSGEATTAIGLLCRMYLGWKHDNPALQNGANWLAKHGPSKGNNYYNYYATQVMRQFDGPMWKAWNAVMRDQMVNTQAREGHEKGSWATKQAGHMLAGGRLYDTSLSTMVLEVYYRHMPIYKAQSVDTGFPLD